MPLDGVGAELEDITDIGFTSGTTGLPKALPGRHRDLLRYADSFLRGVSFSAADRMLCPLQFHYGDPLWLLMASLEVGTPLVMMRRFSVSRFWRVARDTGATMLITIGSIPNLLLTAEPSPAERDHRVRLAVAVAVPKDRHVELVERFGFPWLEYYGSSESGPAIAMPEALVERYVGTGALGLPVPEIEARLVDGDGAVLDGPAVGELELRGEVLFEGYMDDEAATAEVLHDGWLRSGDILRRDEDGMYYFETRRKELIRRGGENIAPAEVEAVLKLHPEVIDAAVVPVADPLRGEEVLAYVQVRPGAVVDPRRARVLLRRAAGAVQGAALHRAARGAVPAHAEPPDPEVGAAGRRCAPRRRRLGSRGRPMSRDDELCFLSAVALSEAMRAGEVSPVEAVDAVLDRIERVNPTLNAFVTITADEARAHAKRAEEELRTRDHAELGLLHGIPTLVKDLTPTAGIRTTFGAASHADHVPDHSSIGWERMQGGGRDPDRQDDDAGLRAARRHRLARSRA